MHTQATGKANNNTVLFYMKVLQMNKLYVVNVASRREHTSYFDIIFSQFPDPV